ncbi:MAG: RagB/SusD family nutrient uptake outer membrane protein [Tannerella sp.]|jgi:hypothetical protein|nr:RagB/SusD family nutrient uptake outer membrane protein [Tannerella sp.]
MNKNSLLYYLICLVLCVSCSALDKDELASITDESVWNDVKYATAYLDKLHRDYIPGWNGSIGADSDEACGEVGVLSAVLFGRMTQTTYGSWKGSYDQIRNVNLLLEKMETSTLDKDTRNLLTAQALVIRAWIYFDLVRKYGGVPMILKTLSLSDDLYVERTKTSECIALIQKDLDDAIAVTNFPYQWSGNDAGRLSKAAALALKGRLLLYWASPQFNPNNQQDRWQAAYDANKNARDLLLQNGYGLYEKYADLFFDEMNKEAVFVKRYEYPHLGHAWESGTRPGESGISLMAPSWNRPTWDLAISYPTISGKPADASNPEYDDVLFWKDRDPRFTSTFVWNSSLFELYNRAGWRQWTYNETNYVSPTHMYCRKAIHTNYTQDDAFAGKNSGDWIEIRYAEVLLNFAECAAALNKTDEALDMLKQIRSRAGIRAGGDGLYGLEAGMSKEAMTKAILLERKLEFAMEGKRFWDLRRYRLFASELNGKYRHGRKPVLREGFDIDAVKADPNIDWDTEYGTYFVDEVDNADLYTIDFKDEYYFYPIHNDDIYTNSKIQQTKGWEGGTFDPLE